MSRETVARRRVCTQENFSTNGKDPAAGCASAWMVASGVAESDERVVIEEGIEMKCPSRICVRASHNDNRIVNVRVGGNAIEVIRGEIFLAPE
ncbi:MAG TPA: hypothetical protein VGS27_21090 [Candidatus Sulfotelmatobacter sp.]|nr:hypothetical protein [Candidatus Sulfotelmatobacter sp.]